MSRYDDDRFVAAFSGDLRRVMRLYRNSDGSRYAASPAVRKARSMLVGFRDWQRLYREDIPALFDRACSVGEGEDSPSAEPWAWLGVLVQYTAEIEHPTHGPFPPHCSGCNRRFTLSFLPELICVTKDITASDVDLATVRIGGMCRDCAGLETPYGERVVADDGQPVANTAENVQPIRSVRVLDVEHLPLVEKLEEVLETEPDLVNRQIAIELVTMRMAVRLGDKDSAALFADGFARHLRRMIGQYPW